MAPTKPNVRSDETGELKKPTRQQLEKLRERSIAAFQNEPFNLSSRMAKDAAGEFVKIVRSNWGAAG